jgi:hypothetical protein
MHWIVAVPDYAGTITTPGGHVTYGFAGINALRDLFTWVGAALLPLTLVYATSRAALVSAIGDKGLTLRGLAVLDLRHRTRSARGMARCVQKMHGICLGVDETRHTHQ